MMGGTNSRRKKFAVHCHNRKRDGWNLNPPQEIYLPLSCGGWNRNSPGCLLATLAWWVELQLSPRNLLATVMWWVEPQPPGCLLATAAWWVEPQLSLINLLATVMWWVEPQLSQEVCLPLSRGGWNRYSSKSLHATVTIENA